MKTNKTKIINSISLNNVLTSNLKNEDVKRVMKLKRLLRLRKNEDIESIEYAYNELIKLYYSSSMKFISIEVKYMLEKTIKLILDGEVILDNSYELQALRYWERIGILY